MTTFRDDLSTSPLSTSSNNKNAFSLYAESSSTHRGSVPSINDVNQKKIVTESAPLNTIEPIATNFVPPPIRKGSSSGSNSASHSRNNSFQQFQEPNYCYPQNTNQTLDPLNLLRIAPNVVKTRKGSVLARNTILKMDHFSSGTNTNLDFYLQGAPNFRIAELNVHGVAQPTVIGLSTILAMLNCHPKSLNPQSCTWFSTREEPLVYLNGTPYVLREYADPMQNMSTFLGINSARLEKVEERLKSDVVKEAKTLGGLLLVHQELPDGAIVPCYIAADEVQTPKEVFQSFQTKGYRLMYSRIPISPEQAPEDNYFDEYINVIRNLEPTDPLVFNCGIGAVRTTVGIIIAQIIRRTQLIERGFPDPFPIAGFNYADTSGAPVIPDEPSTNILVKGLGEADNATARNNAFLRLMHILENALDSKSNTLSAIEWAYERGPLIENLKEAIMGNYQSIVSLSAVLGSGSFSKILLDRVIDRSDAVVNLRESVLTNRIRQTTEVSSADYDESNYLSKALGGLQRYFFLLCFTAYVNESPNTKFENRFSSWIKARKEIWTMLQNMRRKGPRLYFFRPVENLHQLSQSSRGHGKHSVYNNRRAGSQALNQGMFDMTGAGPQSHSDITVEMEEVVLNSRTGIVLTSQSILKVDFWPFGYMKHGSSEENKDAELDDQPQPQPQDLINSNHLEERHHSFVVDGASNFRRVEKTHVYGVAQPTVNGLHQVIRSLRNERSKNDKILWINLREEPIIYINGIPYVLRDRAFTLRNIRAYKGITGSRMEQLEERLKEDIIREVTQYDGRILLHGEDEHGDVRSSWEEVDIQDIRTVREVMESAAADIKKTELSSSDEEENSNSTSRSITLEYHRVPITAEKAPEWRDFDDLKSLVTSVDLSKTAIIMNCQVGLGRSTAGTVIATLLTHWIRPKNSLSGYSSLRSSRSDLTISPSNAKQIPNYQIINSLLRVIKHGLENKLIVDYTLDQCSVGARNLRDTIESARIKAEKEMTEDASQLKRTLKRGIIALERYFMYICFQAYLDDTSPSMVRETETFAAWMKRHPELATILQELMHTASTEDQFNSLAPVEKSLSGDGRALSSEVMDVVQSRHGQVLAQQTILKHDAFPGCQKMSLKEKITDAYNFRRIEIKQVKLAVKYGGLAADVSGLDADMKRDDEEKPLTAPFIAGCAMPNKKAIRAILKAMNAGPGGRRKVFWTCLREEPVVYVKENPYVLRLFVDPLKNLETTGISKDRVESMEAKMKLEVVNELNEYEGRILLHDEESIEGGFNLLPMWETVSSDQVETPSEVFESIRAEGYQVNFLRIPITDEQAPIPDVFDQLIYRMREANQDVDVLFNCQMGRGRTTTGMIVASLLSMILSNDAISDMADSFIVDSSGSVLSASNNQLNYNAVSTPFSIYQTGAEDSNDEAYEERERYLNGEYRVILQLVSVLTYGKLAKRLTDQAINMCDHMQNLRKAIYDYKLRIEAMSDQGSKKWRTTREVALNYLVRYFYLVVFANYLLEEMGTTNTSHITSDESDDDSYSGDNSRSGESTNKDKRSSQPSTAFKEARKLTTFKEWLKGRREIVNIISLQSFDLS